MPMILNFRALKNKLVIVVATTIKEKMNTAAITLFGAGWAWLAQDEKGGLVIVQCPNAGNPVTSGLVPLLCFDVWEHAYYVDYRNRRADHVAALWQIIDWDVVASRMK